MATGTDAARRSSITIGLMAAATGCTGLIPTYAQIGIFAPILLLSAAAARASTGGEWGGAAAFLVESREPGKRGLTGSWQQFSTQIGATGARSRLPARQQPGARGLQLLGLAASRS